MSLKKLILIQLKASVNNCSKQTNYMRARRCYQSEVSVRHYEPSDNGTFNSILLTFNNIWFSTKLHYTKEIRSEGKHYQTANIGVDASKKKK